MGLEVVLLIAVLCCHCCNIEAIPCLRRTACQVLHPQDHYCLADFVIRAEVTDIIDEIKVNGKVLRMYQIKTVEIYKPTSKYVDVPLDERNFIYTATTGSYCGANILKGKEYLLTGNINGENRLEVTRCDWYVLWFKVNDIIERGLSGRYGRSCKTCSVKVCAGCVACYGGKACGNILSLSLKQPRTPGSCVLRIDGNPNWRCSLWNSYCVKRRGSCRFTNQQACKK